MGIYIRRRSSFSKYGGYYTDYAAIERGWAKEAEDKTKRAKLRGECFVGLYAAAKLLTDNHPKRFPYLQHRIKEIESNNLVPKLEDLRYVAKTPKT